MTGQRAYQHSRICNVEENKNNEFKAHHRLSRAEVSDRERGNDVFLTPHSAFLDLAFFSLNFKSRLLKFTLISGERLLQPGSRTLCAFLNINETCKLYLGIRDDGQVNTGI